MTLDIREREHLRTHPDRLHRPLHTGRERVSDSVHPLAPNLPAPPRETAIVRGTGKPPDALDRRGRFRACSEVEGA